MNYFIEGYQDAAGGYFDSRHAANAEYKRGWDACYADHCA